MIIPYLCRQLTSKKPYEEVLHMFTWVYHSKWRVMNDESTYWAQTMGPWSTHSLDTQTMGWSLLVGQNLEVDQATLLGRLFCSFNQCDNQGPRVPWPPCAFRLFEGVFGIAREPLRGLRTPGRSAPSVPCGGAQRQWSERNSLKRWTETIWRMMKFILRTFVVTSHVLGRSWLYKSIDRKEMNKGMPRMVHELQKVGSWVAFKGWFFIKGSRDLKRRVLQKRRVGFMVVNLVKAEETDRIHSSWTGSTWINSTYQKVFLLF